MKTLLLAIVLLSIAVAGIAIKMFFIKGSTFKKTCTSSLADPKTGKPMQCNCGDNDEQHCENK